MKIDEKQAKQNAPLKEYELALLNRLATAFLFSQEDELYVAVLDILLERFESPYGFLGFINKDGDLQCPSLTKGILPDCNMGSKFVVFPKHNWRGAWGESLRKKKTVVHKGTLNPPHGHVPIHSVLAVAIVYKDKLIGQVALANKEEGYSKADQQLLEHVAGFIAPALNSKLELFRQEALRLEAENKLKQRVDELTALNQLSQSITVAHSLDNVVQASLEGAIHALAPDVAIVYLLEDGAMVVKGHFAKDPTFAKRTGMTHPVGDCLCGLTASEERALFSVNIHEDIRCTHPECKESGIHSYATAPLKTGDKLLGVLGVGTTRRTDFSQHRDFLESMAAVISTGIKNALLFEQVKKQAEVLEEKFQERTQALKISEEKYRELVEGANNVILRMVSPGVITYVNTYGVELFGFQEHELVGNNILEAIVPRTDSHGGNLKELVEGIWEQPRKYSINENENMRKDGSRVWIRWSNRAIYDAQGNLQEIQSVGVDITKRKEAERALMQSESRLKQAQNIARLGSFEVDVSQKEQACSDETYRILGYMPGEAPPFEEAFMAHVHPEEQERVRSQYTLFKKSTSSLELSTRLVRPDKSLRYVHLNAVHTTDDAGTVVGLLGTIQDVTEQYEREAELRKLLTAVERCPASIVITNAGGAIQYVNPFFTEVTGYTAEEALGKNPRILKSGEHPREFYKKMWKILRSGETWRGVF